MGGSDNHMNPRRARREYMREMGWDKDAQQSNRELTPEEILQHTLNMQHPRAPHKTVAAYGGRWYQCRRRPIRFWHGTPTDWEVKWVEVPEGTPGPAPAKPVRSAFSHGSVLNVLKERVSKRNKKVPSRKKARLDE